MWFPLQETPSVLEDEMSHESKAENRVELPLTRVFLGLLPYALSAVGERLEHSERTAVQDVCNDLT